MIFKGLLHLIAVLSYQMWTRHPPPKCRNQPNLTYDLLQESTNFTHGAITNSIGKYQIQWIFGESRAAFDLLPSILEKYILNFQEKVKIYILS